MFFSESSNMTSSLPRSTKKEKMKNYLSFGGGVNSVALHLYLLNEGWDFEAVFVDHGTDRPETYEYLDMFQKWLVKRNYKPITVLKPNVNGFDNLYDFCWEKGIIPSRQYKWCTDKFKIQVMQNYFEKPCFNLIGYDYGETKRAKLNYHKGVENRFPLIEAKMTRYDCEMFIHDRNLPSPGKSACYICYNQKQGELIELRREHPCLFQKAVDLEKKATEIRKASGKGGIYIKHPIPLPVFVEEDQYKLFEIDEYPPCNCML